MKLIGARDKTCPFCGQAMFYIETKIGVFSQCKTCGCLTKGKVKKEIKIVEGDTNEQIKTIKKGDIDDKGFRK